MCACLYVYGAKGILTSLFIRMACYKFECFALRSYIYTLNFFIDLWLIRMKFKSIKDKWKLQAFLEKEVQSQVLKANQEPPA